MQEMLLVLAVTGISAGVFLTLAIGLKIEEWRLITGMVWRRLPLRNGAD